MAMHKYVHPQERVMDRGTVGLYLWCDHCWLRSPRLGNWQWIFACFCRLSTNHTYLTCRNFVCQHSVTAETTVKRCAFVFIVFELQNVLKMYCECWNTQLFITFKWEQILQTRSHILLKSQHNSVLHAFSVPDWSEMCGVVGVLTVFLLLPTQ